MANHITHRQVVYRLLPQKRSNWRWLEHTLEAQRRLYNAALEERIDCYRKTGVSISYYDQCKSLTECRRGLPDMAACPVAVQRGTLKRFDEACQGFFRRVKAGQAAGFPRFQGRRRFDSLAVISGVKVEGGRLRIPSFGWMTIRRRGGNPYPDGEPVSAVLKRNSGRWCAVVCHAIVLPEPVDDGRAANFPLAINNHRFLLLPGVRVHGLASRVLELAAGRVAADWETAYRARPVLAYSYPSSEHAGTCYRAAPALHVDEDTDWAGREYARSTLPDGRVRGRIERMRRAWLERPGAAVPAIFPARADRKAAHRLLSSGKVSMEHILEPHQATMVERWRLERLILAIQDTTTLNHDGLAATGGLVGVGDGGKPAAKPKVGIGFDGREGEEMKEKDAGWDFGMERYGIGWRVLVREGMGCERRSRQSVVFRS